ncbi:unnamed protein product [Sympodiomycopsis kandeliae]
MDGINTSYSPHEQPSPDTSDKTAPLNNTSYSPHEQPSPDTSDKTAPLNNTSHSPHEQPSPDTSYKTAPLNNTFHSPREQPSPDTSLQNSPANSLGSSSGSHTSAETSPATSRYTKSPSPPSSPQKTFTYSSPTSKNAAIPTFFRGGEASQAEAFKFAEWHDRRYPLLFLPVGNLRVSIYLVGDPGFVHEGLANRMQKRIESFATENEGRMATQQSARMVRHLTDYLERLSSPTTNINVREAGQVKARRFHIGTAMKEPDALWVSGPKFPTKRSFCALEVASKNEGLKGLIFECKLWTELSTRATAPVKKPVNFVGIWVDESNQDQDGISFVVIKAKAADKMGRGVAYFTIMNASSEMEELCQTEADKQGLSVVINNDDHIDIEYGHFCPPLLSREEWRGMSFSLTHLELTETVEAMWQLEADRAQLDSPDAGAWDLDEVLALPSSEE